MNPKSQQQPPTINRKLITLSLFFLFILYVLTRPDFRPIKIRHEYLPNTCNKLPLSVSESLVHYATSRNTTPQQTLGEISVTLRALQSKSPCNFLIFGLGHDSLLWATLNHNGRTMFLEDSKEWIAEVKKRAPSLEVRQVAYDTRVGQADELLREASGGACRVVGDPRSSRCQLALKDLPNEVYEAEWDLIMVDAPIGMPSLPESPGRMKAIYTAGLMARNRKEGETEVFVHDVDRHVEDSYSRTFLCEGYQRVEVNKLRHFTIPSHRASSSSTRPFCP
ncbi:Glucuronoxylan 4-O-methyltransferase 3 [Striga hermonthica]|uniref:Glucuronoxylan 4-O-methyltransferase 3 n=1 Tax=Striga hermonthica TaxID=68872 RepID=A0A9N7MFX9_STRHE|nr:Glucuronoxylan 4-O-methyltransferase 3 [Striga hermonthica]